MMQRERCGPVVWMLRLADWRASGLSLAAYCRGRSLLSDGGGVATAVGADVVGSVACVLGAAMMPVLAVSAVGLAGV